MKLIIQLSKSKKENYEIINKKLNDQSTSSKTYCSIMETFFSGKKVPAICPLLFMVRLSQIFKKKQIFSICFFTKQCPLDNSVLPIEFTYMTKECIHSLTFSESDVIKIIRAFDVNKAHGHDNILVRMIKLCANSVTNPLILICQNSLAAGTFTTQWKRGKYFSNP